MPETTEFLELESYYIATNAWPQLLELYEKACDDVEDPEAKKILLRKLAYIYGNVMGDFEGAARIRQRARLL